MTSNRAVTYLGPGKVAVQEIPYPKLEVQSGPGVPPANVGRQCQHGVILKVVSTNICGSDQHMVRGRTTA
ncbi:MAG: fdhA, partial [Mycobacterium sp.]|nr:fdhA [Mycobacterium sp.]MCW2590816.1 fdhA [Mycobacterium sp.]